MRIIYIDIDSCRADHLGCYGYHRNTSPNIDRLAREGVRFQNYYCSDAPCLPSRTALYTGQFGIHTGVVGHGGTAADPRVDGPGRQFRNRWETDSLPNRLQQTGMHTAQISPFGQRHSAHHFMAGFHEVHNTGNGGMESAEEVQPVVRKWLRDNAKDNDNFYLHLNYWDPHTPYRVPPEFENPFRDEPLPDWLTEEVLEKHKTMVGAHKALNLEMFSDQHDPRFPHALGKFETMDDLKRFIDAYDHGIRYVDDQIGEILAILEEQGVLDETVIMISADHGENQGELGIYGEHGTADQITCNVPMIVSGPGVAKGQVSDALHYQVDMAPTLCEWTGANPSEKWDGRSFLAELKGEANPHPWDYIVFGQCCHVVQRAVRFGDYLYIRTFHDGYHLFPREMLFDVKNDPQEQFDLAPDQPELCDRGLRYLTEWTEDQMLTSDWDTDPLWTVIREGGPFHAKGKLPEYLELLERTGREWAVPELKKRHPQEFAR